MGAQTKKWFTDFGPLEPCCLSAALEEIPCFHDVFPDIRLTRIGTGVLVGSDISVSDVEKI